MNQIQVDKGQAEITYFLKIVRTNSYLKGEEMNTIAVTESESHIAYIRNPYPGADNDPDKVEISVNGGFSNWGYVIVIAQIQQNNIIEYNAYDGIFDLKPDSSDKSDDDKNKNGEEEEGDNTVLFAAIGGILGAIAIGLVVVIVVFQLRNKKLLDQVKHVSFQKTNATVDPNLLLQKPSEEAINSA